ncbi:hypothetical protein [Micromonospora qiuiae]|nr:hypothetical protein [Micromonospora qiuiae]
MAHRTLIRLMLTAFGVSLLVGAGQLGLAFGFGIIRLTGAFTGATANQWPAQLVWVGWFVMNAAVAGAMLTEQLARRDERLTGTERQVAVAASAALGAMVVAPLCMQPARSAEVVTIDPVWAVAICAMLGAVIGVGAALAVLMRPPFAWNVAAVAGVMWLLALLAVAPALGASGPLAPVRLGVLEPAWLDADTAQQLALLILPTLTLLVGAATGGLARWYRYPPLVSGPSGAAGPLLVAFAYLAAGPGGIGDRYQLSPYYGALIAVAVGALGSAAAALVPWSPGRSPATGAIEPSAVLPPLPATPALPTPTGPSTSAETSTSPATAPTSPAIATGRGPDATASTSTPTAAKPLRPAGRPPVLPLAGGDTAQQAEPLGSPPHWHWPDDRITPRTPPATPGTSLPGPPPANVVNPAASPPVAPTPAAPTPTGSPPTGSTPTASTPTASPPTASPPAVSTLAGPGIDEGGPHRPADAMPVEPSVDSSPVGDGSDIPAAVRTTAPESAPTSGTPTSGGAGEATPAEAPPRPRHQFPMPDLGRATTWKLTPTQQPAPLPTVDEHVPPVDAEPPAPGQKEPRPAETEQPADHQKEPRSAGGTEPVAGSEAPPAGIATDPGPPGGPARPDPAHDAAATRSAPVPRISTDPAAAIRDVSAAFTRPPAARAEEAQPDGGDRRDKSGRRGLFRRGGSRSDATAAEREEPLAAQDEEYVHWVAELSRPIADDEPAPKKTRRSLRPSGRHHRD